MVEGKKFLFNCGNFYETFSLVYNYDDNYVSLISIDEVAQWIVTEVPCDALILNKVVRFLERLERQDTPILRVKELLEMFIEREAIKLSIHDLV